MYKSIFVVSLLILSGCQKKIQMVRYRWSSNDTKKNPEENQKLFGSADFTVKVYDEIVERHTQRIGGAIVDSSFLQKVTGTKGDTHFISSQYGERDLSYLATSAAKLRNFRYSALETMKRKNLDLKTASHIFEPEVIITGSDDSPVLRFKFDYIPKDSSGVYSMVVSPSFSIVSIKKMEHCFNESRSFVFPSGPRLSGLIETILRPLIGDGSLTGPRVMITSEDGLKVQAEDGAFLFGPEDSRFDHVQAFFFSQKALSYAESHWQFSLPFPLKIGLRAGFPEKRNTAYYYKGLIRLGDGDGVTYQGIPRDPSIVTHEVAHAIVDALSGLGTEGEPASLNEAFADYFTASIWQNPELGHTAFLTRSYTRTVDNKFRFSDRNGGIYHDSALMSGTLWDIEKQLGSDKAQILAIKTLIRLGAQPQFTEVPLAINDAMTMAAWTEGDRAQVKEILNLRGWPAIP